MSNKRIINYSNVVTQSEVNTYINSAVQSINSTTNSLQTNLTTTNQNLTTTNQNLTTTNQNLTNLNTSYNNSQNLLFSENNILFEDGFNSINEIKICSSIVTKIKHIISSNTFDYLFNKVYNYSVVIRPELNNLFATDPDLVTKVVVQSTYPNEKTFSYNNIVYDKNESYSLNNFDNLDISQVTNMDKTIVGLLNSYATNYLNSYLLQNPSAIEFYSIKSFSITNFNSIPQIAYFYFKLNQAKNIWTVISAITDLGYNSIINDNNNTYQNFTNAINNLLNKWTPNSTNSLDDNITTIIEYKSPLLFESTKCLFSTNYPTWTNNLLTNLHKNNETYDVVSEYNNTINSLWYSYPLLKENDIVIISGFMGEEYYCNIIKIVKYPSVTGVLGFIQQKIDIRPFFTDVGIKNDITINGTFKVKSSNGENIIQTDNIKNVISFNDKIGINQEIYSIKGLLDIDNLSNKSVDMIMTEFKNTLLDSYTITEQLKINNLITYNNLVNNSTLTNIYTQYKFSIFHTEILQSIEDGNIIFDHVESDINFNYKNFSQKNLTFNSFAKIKQIVTELYTMIYLEKLVIDNNLVLSFIENLSDGTGNYMCSIRALIKYNTDKTSYKIYFITTYLPIQKYYNNLSYKKELDLLINNYSQVHRFINYSKLILNIPNIKQNIINGKTNDGTNNTYSGFINSSNYFRDRFGNSSLYMSIQYFPEDVPLTLLHEKYPFWENKRGIINYIPNTDISLQSIIEILNENYITNFGQFKDNYIFPVTYYFSTGIKISFLEPIYFANKKYFMIVGINLNDIISESILLKGDNKITGNISIIDEKTGNNIFNVDTKDKQSYVMYNMGIGKFNPETKLDILDCGLNDVTSIINMLSSKFNIINYNVQQLKTAINNAGITTTVLIKPAYYKKVIKYVNKIPIITYVYVPAEYGTVTSPPFEGFTSFIETKFKDLTINGTNNLIIQNKNNYFTVTEIPFDSNKNIILDNIIQRYNFIYPEWNNKKISELLTTEIQKKTIAEFLYNANNLITSNNNYFDGSYQISYYPWINGITINIGYNFVAKNVLYTLSTNIDIQNNLTYETNKNISKILEILCAQSNSLQRLIPTLPGFTTLNLINTTLTKNNIDIRLQNNLKGKLFKYVIDLYDTNNIIIQELNVSTLTNIGNQKEFINLNITKEDFQLRNKITNLISNLKNKFSAYVDIDPSENNGLEKIPYLYKGYYGIIHMEDDYYDYFSTFWVFNDEFLPNTTSPTQHLVTIYSYEINLEEVLNTSVKIHGDTTLEGDLYINDSNTKEPFIFADATNKYFGINTSQIYSNYNVDYSTTTNNEMATNNVYIKSNTYPNTIIERTTELDPSIIPLSTTITTNPPPTQLTNKPDGQTSYYYFKNFSTLTARRQSDYYTFSEMETYSKLCRNNITTYYSDDITVKPNAFGTNKQNVYCYGADKNYEIKDKTGIVKELGCVSIGIEKYDSQKFTAKGAFYVNMVDTVPNTATPFERNIMYCSNDSNLYVNNVTTNGVRFGGHPDTPYSSGDLSKLLWVDTDSNGNPRLRFGNKVVNLTDP